MLYMSIKQYSEHSGLSCYQIRADCKEKKLPTIDNGRQKYMINVVKADKYYESLEAKKELVIKAPVRESKTDVERRAIAVVNKMFTKRGA